MIHLQKQNQLVLSLTTLNCWNASKTRGFLRVTTLLPVRGKKFPQKFGQGSVQEGSGGTRTSCRACQCVVFPGTDKPSWLEAVLGKFPPRISMF